jgi:hypothetical protein
MKIALNESLLPQGAVLLTCSSHEERCRGLLTKASNWLPSAVVLFHYDDENPKREVNHHAIKSDLGPSQQYE